MSGLPIFSASRNWDAKQLPDELKGWPMESSDPDSLSEFHEGGTTYARLNTFTAKAVVEFCKQQDSAIGLVRVGSGVYASEFRKDDGTVLLFKLDKNGNCCGAVQEPSGRYTNIPTFGVKTNRFNSTGIFMCILMQVCEQSPDTKAVLDAEVTQYAANHDFEATGMYKLCDAVYYALTTNRVKCVMTGGNVDMLTGNTVAMGMLSGTVLCGAPELIAPSSVRTAGYSKQTFAQARRQFAAWADAQSWSDAEKKLIPSFPDDFPVMAETVKMCSRFVSTREDRRPMVNFMWRGTTSIGKSTGVAMMAALLNMPLLRITCNSNMETQDFLSSIVPVGDSEIHGICGELPSFMDMMLDPASAYLALTGEEKETASSQDCLEAYAKAAVSRSGQGSDRLFQQVKSPYVEALEHGYIVEVQEISRIKDSGVLVGLNEYDRPGALIPLVNGGTVTRHPNAIVVFTDNVGYVSCRPVDPSVLRRMAFIIDSDALSQEDALERVIYNTNFQDRALLEKMYEVWEKVQEHCADKDITEGSVSLTELEMWAQCVMADGYTNLRENCLDCVVSKATSVREEQSEIISAVVDLLLTA